MAYNAYNTGKLYDSGALYKDFTSSTVGTAKNGRISFDAFGRIPYGEVNATTVARIRDKYTVRMYYFDQAYTVEILRDTTPIYSVSDPSFSYASIEFVDNTLTFSNRDHMFQHSITESVYQTAGAWAVYTDWVADASFENLDAPTIAKPTLSAVLAGTTVTISAASAGATLYRFYRDGALIATQAGGSYADTLSLSGTYTYTAIAFIDSVASPLSDPDSVTFTAASAPGAPTLTAVSENGQVTLTVVPVVGAVGYTFYRDADLVLDTSVTTVYDTPASGTYSYTAKAYNDVGESAASVAASVTHVAPSAPLAPTLTAVLSGGAVTLVAYADDTVQYEFYVDGVLIATDDPHSGTMVYDLVAYGTFSFTAKAQNGVGLSPESAAQTVTYADPTVVVEPGGGVPAKPILTASITANKVSLVASSTGALTYRFYRNTVQVGIRADGTFTDTIDATAYGTYTYTAIANNADGDSEVSDPKEVVYVAPASTDPPPVEGHVIHTFPTGGNDVRFSVLLDKLFMTNGTDNIVCWDGDMAHLANTVTDRTSQGPVFPYIMTFRDRLWLAGRGSTVMYCGSADTEKVDGVEVQLPRWRNWSGSLPSDGGSLVIGAGDGQQVTGLASLNDGVVVFKSRTTYLWTYSPDAIPKTEGSIVTLVSGVGCAGHDTICYRRGAVVFLGQTDDGDYGVYVLSGASCDVLSEKIPDAISRVLSTSTRQPKAFMQDDVYYLACDEENASGVRSWVYAYDFTRKVWYEIVGWQVGAFGRSEDGKRIRIGSAVDNAIAEYPLGTSDSSKPIEWSLTTRSLDGGNAFMDHRWRTGYVDMRSTSSSSVVDFHIIEDGGAERSFPSTIGGGVESFYDDGSLYDSGRRFPNVKQDKRIAIPLDSRSRTIQLRVSGSTTSETSIQRVGATLRDRKVRT